MAETKQTSPVVHEPIVIDKAQHFWNRYSKRIGIALTIVVVLTAAYLAYNSFVKVPNVIKSEEAIFKAEDYFRSDSLDKALNGDGINPGFLKVISKYGGTEAANRAHLMAGTIYLKKGDYKNAIKHLEQFKTSAKQVEARATALLADANAELGASTSNNSSKEKAAQLYKKAADIFEKDDLNSPEYLFRAGYLYESMGKNKEAIDTYMIIKEKYPRSERGYDIDKYLARLGKTDPEGVLQGGK